jgi:hypothetical protein
MDRMDTFKAHSRMVGESLNKAEFAIAYTCESIRLIVENNPDLSRAKLIEKITDMQHDLEERRKEYSGD